GLLFLSSVQLPLQPLASLAEAVGAPYASLRPFSLLLSRPSSPLSPPSRCGEILNVDASQVGLFATPDKAKELVDLATVGDQEVENDQIVYLVLRKSDGYEDVDVTQAGGASAMEEEHQ
ncbi:unnamed protein product, partial [Chrysoparadoxa australica]